MNGQDRDHNMYGRYSGYTNDEHYHSARNLTDEFERKYRRQRGDQYRNPSNNNMPRSYHEGNDMENTYQMLRRNEDSFRDRTDYMNNNRDYDRNYYGSSARADDDQNNYRGNLGRYIKEVETHREDRGRSREQGDRTLRSDNEGQYNPYNSNSYSKTREHQDYDSGSRGNYRRSSTSDRDNRGGSSYSGFHGSNSDRDKNREMRGSSRQGDDRSNYGGTSQRYSSIEQDDSRRSGQRDYNAGFGDGFKGTRYGGNSDYLSYHQSGSYSDRDYRGSTSYTGLFERGDNDRYNMGYSMGSDRNKHDDWYNKGRSGYGIDKRRRYY